MMKKIILSQELPDIEEFPTIKESILSKVSLNKSVTAQSLSEVIKHARRETSNVLNQLETAGYFKSHYGNILCEDGRQHKSKIFKRVK